MNNTNRFPKIMVRNTETGFEGLAGLKLKSILKGHLISAQLDNSQKESSDPYYREPKKWHQAREAFLRAVSGWQSSGSLEMHLTVVPDLIHKAQGRIMISLFLRVPGSSQEEVKEGIIDRYLNLVPLLIAHFPEEEFVPITAHNELERRIAPFSPGDAVAVHRRRQALSLSSPLIRRAVGFDQIKVNNCSKSQTVNHLFPWVPSLDDWSRVMDTLMWQLDPKQLIIRLRPGAESDNAMRRLEEAIRTCELFLSGIKEYQLTLNRQTSLIRDLSLKQLASLRDSCFNLGIYILSPHRIDTSLINVVAHSMTSPQDEFNGNNLFQGGYEYTKVDVEDALEGGYFFEKEPFIVSEAACAFRLPSPPMQDHPGLPIKRSRTSIALASFKNKGINETIDLFINEHHGMAQPVVMDADDRMRHTFIIGQTGTGKSTLMEHMILQDIRAGTGVAVVDPHGEMVDSILGKIPKERTKDVILFDVLDRKRPLGFNLIHWRTLEERDLIIDELYLTLDRIYGMRSVGGPIFEANFRGMLKLLMGETTRRDFVPTVLDFTSCYLSRGFRNWLKNYVKDPHVMDFLEELERTGGEASLQNLSPYITSKFSRFIHDTTLMRIVGQEKTSFDFEDIMNNGKIFLIKLGKGRFGTTVSAMMANQLVARFKLAAMKRGDMRPQDRPDFFLYVDECHNLPSENFMELLSEARKYRMGLILATQYSAQLSQTLNNESDLLPAIFGNVGTIIIFRLGQEDALKLSQVLNPYFTTLDIIGLPNWQGYVRLQTGQDSIPPFSFRTERDTTAYDAGVATHIRRASRLRYGKDAKEIDAQIARRRSIWKEGQNYK